MLVNFRRRGLFGKGDGNSGRAGLSVCLLLEGAGAVREKENHSRGESGGGISCQRTNLCS